MSEEVTIPNEPLGLVVRHCRRVGPDVTGQLENVSPSSYKKITLIFNYYMTDPEDKRRCLLGQGSTYVEYLCSGDVWHFNIPASDEKGRTRECVLVHIEVEKDSDGQPLTF